MLTDIAKAAEEAGPMRASSLIRRRGDQRRTRHRAAVSALAAVAVGAIVAIGTFAGMHRTANNVPAVEPSTSASAAVTASPTATASPSSAPASPTDLTLYAGQILTNGSSGNIEGTVELSVQNHGPAATDRIDLTFTLTSGVQPTGAAWTGCAGPDAHQVITCTEPAPAVGASRDFTFQFAIVTEKLGIGSNQEPILPSVTAQPHGATDTTPADNAVTLTMCTNGCSPLSVSLTGLTQTTLAIGGKKAEFTVTVTNTTVHTFRKIAPNVAVDHCTCVDAPQPMAPNGTLEWLQPDGSWKTIQYANIGGGMDYINVTQVPGFTLTPGSSVSFTFRLGFTSPHLALPYHNGETSIDVTMVGLVGYTAFGPTTKEASPDDPGAYAIAILGPNAAPAASVPIQVTTN